MFFTQMYGILSCYFVGSCIELTTALVSSYPHGSAYSFKNSRLNLPNSPLLRRNAIERDISNISKEDLGTEIQMKLTGLLTKKNIRPSKLGEISSISTASINRWWAGINAKGITLLDATQISQYLGLESPLDLLMEPKKFIEKYELTGINVKVVKHMSIEDAFENKVEGSI